MAWMLFLIIPYSDVRTDRVDVIEINHLYDDEGKHVLDQWIAWDWCPSERAYRVVDWRILQTPHQRPVSGPCGVRSLWVDKDCVRRVRCVSVRETWTQVDPETADRQRVAVELRRKLIR